MILIFFISIGCKINVYLIYIHFGLFNQYLQITLSLKVRITVPVHSEFTLKNFPSCELKLFIKLIHCNSVSSQLIIRDSHIRHIYWKFKNRILYLLLIIILYFCLKVEFLYIFFLFLKRKRKLLKSGLFFFFLNSKYIVIYI